MLGTIIAGKYEILRVVGRGGMGEVFEARHAGLERNVAIKILHEHAFADAKWTERFLREARLAAQLKSEHSVHIYDVDRLRSGRPYIVMELLEGEDLDQVLRNRTLDIGESIDFAIQAAEALVEAHDRGLVHRDLKPHNLFLSGTHVKVLDFGLARALDPTKDPVTHAGSILGTPSFMSPEQIRAPREVDQRADLYSLGATLFMLIAGRPPFVSADIETLIEHILTAPAPDLRKTRPEVPDAVADVVKRALEKAPAARFRDAREMIEALRAAQVSFEAGDTQRDEGMHETSDAPGPQQRTAILGGTERLPPPAPREPSKEPPPPPAASDTLVAGRFRILAVMGVGGMGKVYRAHDQVLDRLVALKIMREEGENADRRRRVIREARAAAAVTHPNLVTIFDVGEDGDRIFLAMELVEGESLRSIILRRKSTLEQRVRWLRDAAVALQAAHDRGLVHRDVKPENMLVCPDGSLKLLDFGIAKRSVTEIEVDFDSSSSNDDMGPSSLDTSRGRRVGTWKYMAPEQRDAKPTDGRTDQYAWGLIALELLGRDPALPAPLTKAIEKAVSHEKEDRFPSMQPIIDVLSARKSTSRRFVYLAALSGVLSLLAIGIVFAQKKPSQPGTTPVSSASMKRPKFACTATPAENVAVGKSERVGLDVEGDIVIAKNLGKVPEIGKHTPEGWKSLIPKDGLYDIGTSFDDVQLFPSHEHGKPALIAAFPQRGPYVIWSFGQKYILGVTRVDGHITGLAATEFEKSPVVVSTTDTTGTNFATTSMGVTLIETRTGEFGLLEKGPSYSPTVASDIDHVVVAWRTDDSVHAAFADSYLVPLRPPITVASRSVPPAITFDGKYADVYWTSPQLMRTRIPIEDLDASTFETIAIGHEAANPYAVELGNKHWGLVWTELVPTPIVRFSPLDEKGDIIAPIELARGVTADNVMDPHARNDTPRLVWHDGNGFHTTKLSCGAH